MLWRLAFDEASLECLQKKGTVEDGFEPAHRFGKRSAVRFDQMASTISIATKSSTVCAVQSRYGNHGEK